MADNLTIFMCWSCNLGTSTSWNHQGLYEDCFFRTTGINMTDKCQDALQKSQNLPHPFLHTIYVLHYSIFCLILNTFCEGLLPLFPTPPKLEQHSLWIGWEDIISLHRENHYLSTFLETILFTKNTLSKKFCFPEYKT